VGIPPEATFASIACRLTILATDVVAADALDALEPKLAIRIVQASDGVARARSGCANGRPKQARTGLAMAVRKLVQIETLLRSPKARGASDATRAALVAESSGIRSSMTTLRQQGCAP